MSGEPGVGGSGTRGAGGAGRPLSHWLSAHWPVGCLAHPSSAGSATHPPTRPPTHPPPSHPPSYPSTHHARGAGDDLAACVRGVVLALPLLAVVVADGVEVLLVKLVPGGHLHSGWKEGKKEEIQERQAGWHARVSGSSVVAGWSAAVRLAAGSQRAACRAMGPSPPPQTQPARLSRVLQLGLPTTHTQAPARPRPSPPPSLCARSGLPPPAAARCPAPEDQQAAQAAGSAHMFVWRHVGGGGHRRRAPSAAAGAAP